MAKKKKKPRKIPLPVRISRLKKKADKALSEYVRAVTIAEYGKCPLCLDGVERPVEACFHFIRRKAAPWLRWVYENVIGSCHRCNWIEYRNPDPSRAWYIRRYGHERYLRLVDLAHPANKSELGENHLQTIVDKYTGLLLEINGTKLNPDEPPRPR